MATWTSILILDQASKKQIIFFIEFLITLLLNNVYLFSSLNSCEVGSTRKTSFNDNDVILYEEGDGNATQYEDHHLNEKDLKENGGVNGMSFSSITNTIKNFFKRLKNLFSKKSKRIFIKMHQYIGCSHLMSVRYFLASINNCSFLANFCKTQIDFLTNNNSTTTKINASKNPNNTKCHVNTKDEIKWPARMGYYADLSFQTFKTSFGNFFLNTTGQAPFCERRVKKKE